MRGICAQCNGYRDGSRPYRQGQGQRIKRISEWILRVNFTLGIPLIVAGTLLQQRPSSRDDHQSAAHLNNWQRNSEEREDMRADEVRPDQQEKTVDGDPPGQLSPRARRIVPGHCQKNWASAERIYDREQRADNQEKVFHRFHNDIFQTASPSHVKCVLTRASDG